MVRERDGSTRDPGAPGPPPSRRGLAGSPRVPRGPTGVDCGPVPDHPRLPDPRMRHGVSTPAGPDASAAPRTSGDPASRTAAFAAGRLAPRRAGIRALNGDSMRGLTWFARETEVRETPERQVHRRLGGDWPDRRASRAVQPALIAARCPITHVCLILACATACRRPWARTPRLRLGNSAMLPVAQPLPLRLDVRISSASFCASAVPS